LLACLFVAVQASAQATAAGSSPEPDAAAQLLLAETLYREGRRLASEQRYAEAVAKLSESYRIDPGVGTLLALAVCHEAQGRLATAWVEFSDAMRAAQRDKRDDRVQLAREHLAQIEPKLSRLTIAVAPQAASTDLELRLDGVRIGPAAQGVALPVDPGRHQVEASAKGRLSFSQEVVIGPNADQRVIVVPALGEPPPIAPPLAPAPPAVVGPRAPDRVASARPIPTSVYVAGVASFALAGAAIGTGVAYGEGAENCHRDSSRCDAARRVGWLNIGLTTAAAVGAGVTLYLYVSRPSATTEAASVSVWGDPASAGVRYFRAF
jgi:hypothetical protein